MNNTHTKIRNELISIIHEKQEIKYSDLYSIEKKLNCKIYDLLNILVHDDKFEIIFPNFYGASDYVNFGEFLKFNCSYKLNYNIILNKLYYIEFWMQYIT